MKHRAAKVLGAILGTTGVVVGMSMATTVATTPVGTAPAGSAEEAPTIDVSAILADGVLDVGTAVGNPPWAFVVEGQDDPSGFDMDLAQALADELGVELNIEVAEFPTLIPSLESGRYDAVLSSLTIRDDRLEALNMLAYMQIATGVLVPAGNPEGLTGLEDACGLRIGVAQGSANEAPVAEVSEGCGDDPIEIVSTQGNDFVALESGQVELMVLDAAGAFYTALERGDTFEAPDAVYGAGLAGIGTAKENTALIETLQAALLALIDNGDYDELLEQWNLTEIGHTGAEINPAETPAEAETTEESSAAATTEPE